MLQRCRCTRSRYQQSEHERATLRTAIVLTSLLIDTDYRQHLRDSHSSTWPEQ